MATNYLDTGDTGRAVSSESDGALFAGIFGAEKYVLENGSQLKAEVQSNNIVKISDGDAVMYGRHVRIQANDSALVTINNGHSGTKRIDLIVFRYTKDSTGKETVNLVVIQGEDSTWTPTAPTAVNGNILTGAMKSDFPLYSVELNGINIVKVNPLFNVIGNISKLNEEFTELNGKSYELIKVSDNRYVKKYADGRFEAYGHVAIKDLVFANQIGTSGVYYAQYQNLNIGITAKTISSVQHTANNSGVVWTGNASVSGIAMKGTILQYGSTSRSTDLNYDVKGTWK